MAYIVESKVKQFIHDGDRQVTKDGLHAIEVKFVEFLAKLCNTHNGGHKRIDANYVNCFNKF